MWKQHVNPAEDDLCYWNSCGVPARILRLWSAAWRHSPFCLTRMLCKKKRCSVCTLYLCVFVMGLSSKVEGSTVVTLKMVALCGRGGAGRDGDVVTLEDGGWLGGDGPLIEALTDLEHERRNYIPLIIHLMILISYKWHTLHFMKSKHIKHSNWLHSVASSRSAAFITNKRYHIKKKWLSHLKEFNSHVLDSPELLDRVLLTGVKQAQQGFSFDADNQSSSQYHEESHQDAHSQTPIVCLEHTQKKNGSFSDCGPQALHIIYAAAYNISADLSNIVKVLPSLQTKHSAAETNVLRLLRFILPELDSVICYCWNPQDRWHNTIHDSHNKSAISLHWSCSCWPTC